MIFCIINAICRISIIAKKINKLCLICDKNSDTLLKQIEMIKSTADMTDETVIKSRLEKKYLCQIEYTIVSVSKELKC